MPPLVSPRWLIAWVLFGLAVYFALLWVFARFVKAHKRLQEKSDSQPPATKEEKHSSESASNRVSRQDRLLASFELTDTAKAATGALTALALGASVYAFFVEELTRQANASLAFSVTCDGDSRQMIRVRTFSQQPVSNCELEIWPTLLSDAQGAVDKPPKPKPTTLPRVGFDCLPGESYSHAVESALYGADTTLVDYMKQRGLRVKAFNAVIYYNRPPRDQREQIAKENLTCADVKR